MGCGVCRVGLRDRVQGYSGSRAQDYLGLRNWAQDLFRVHTRTGMQRERERERERERGKKLHAATFSKWGQVLFFGAPQAGRISEVIALTVYTSQDPKL